MVLGCGAFELRLGRSGILRHALRALKQQRAELVGGLWIAKIAGEPIPARSLAFVAGDRRAVAVNLADQRHRRGVLWIGVEALFSLHQRVKEIAALIGAKGQIRRDSVRSRRQRRRQTRARSGLRRRSERAS